jgi:hypothetical protein
VHTTAAVRRCFALVAALLVGLVAAVAVAAPAIADPGQGEGGSNTLREKLDTATRGYLDAKARLETSRKRQQQLSAEAKAVEAELAARSAAVAELAAAAYRAGPLVSTASLLGSGSPATLLDRLTLLDAIATNEDQLVRALVSSRERLTRAKAAVEAEVAKQQKQLAVMKERKEQAEKALREVGGQSTSGPSGSSSSTAKPAPRNSDGSWPSQSCSLNDPTTSGCITPRMLHALNQAKAAGFTRYVSCFRSSGSGEHPKGRACDFAAQKSGFGGVATGGDRTYGNNLAAFFIGNAGRLAVLYVIWFRKIWLPSSGWRSYNGGGDPSSDHTNHVHLSVY